VSAYADFTAAAMQPIDARCSVHEHNLTRNKTFSSYHWSDPPVPSNGETRSRDVRCPVL